MTGFHPVGGGSTPSRRIFLESEDPQVTVGGLAYSFYRVAVDVGCSKKKCSVAWASDRAAERNSNRITRLMVVSKAIFTLELILSLKIPPGSFHPNRTFTAN